MKVNFEIKETFMLREKVVTDCMEVDANNKDEAIEKAIEAIANNHKNDYRRIEKSLKRKFVRFIYDNMFVTYKNFSVSE